MYFKIFCNFLLPILFKNGSCYLGILKLRYIFSEYFTYFARSCNLLLPFFGLLTFQRLQYLISISLPLGLTYLNHVIDVRYCDTQTCPFCRCRQCGPFYILSPVLFVRLLTFMGTQSSQFVKRACLLPCSVCWHFSVIGVFIWRVFVVYSHFPLL